MNGVLIGVAVIGFVIATWMAFGGKRGGTVSLDSIVRMPAGPDSLVRLSPEDEPTEEFPVS